jgi:uncharacterized protein (DUF885 family)
VIRTLFVIAAFAVAAPVAAKPAAPGGLAKVIADYEAVQKRFHPWVAAQDGDREALSRLEDDSPANLKAEQQALLAIDARLKALPPTDPKSEDAVNRGYLAFELKSELTSLKLDTARINFDAYSGFHLEPQELGHHTRIRDRADTEAYLKRLAALPHYYETEIANARRGVATHFTQPAPTVEVVLAIARKQAAVPAEADGLMTPLNDLPSSIPAADQAELRGRALALVKAFKPSETAFVRFLETEYAPAARKSLAARDLPNGEAYYRAEVARHTTTDLTPDQIHQIGLDEVKRIRALMEEEIKASGFTGDFKAFQQFLRTDPQFYVTTRQALLEKSAMFAKTVDDKLPREFGRLPRLPFAVREIPREVEESATTAYYEEGSPALGVAGGYEVNTSHLDQRPLYEIPALSLHESQPGHHLQIALQQERTDLPSFRRNGGLTAFVEGWGLYSEQLGDEMGLYRTPYERFGHLSYEMWRACRLVADTGIHWLRWSRDQARACFTDNTALSPKNIEVELDRYISWPGQALGYKIGELKIMAARKRAEAALGDRFDVRAFHDAVLIDGPVPLDLLDRRIDAWIAVRTSAKNITAK